ncbi:uncharacterized protein BT62DRAFT_1011808 [Guyanagaster necrorhizus]|uniref:Uncharacterized protein n=1 Tax=Guyanagaster necrorhizus TaxID=856835 RepID=A0A9P7VJS0_9AGAR|nr:uncharacterized protein BT62DRAFT_1011808 [Guyanagaster necrorhizus MCA 3950]KAG7441224.1 hypothetical protein BT62DRAFT_1011808 [Guyanagaster necrorhizus MCA 3950]
MDVYYTPADLSENVILEMTLDGVCLFSHEGNYQDSYEEAMADIRAFYEGYAPTPVFDDIPSESEPPLTLEDWEYLQSICHFDLGFGGDVPTLEDTPDSFYGTDIYGLF